MSRFTMIKWHLLCFTVTFWLSSCILAQITPPPKKNDDPVIANDRVYYLKTFPVQCGVPIIDKFPGGYLIKDSRAMMKKDNPHIINGMIHIAPTGCLYIEPGAVLKFAAGQGMIINGTLIARGSELPGGRITMTKFEGEDQKRPSGDWQDDARLVMGNTTKDGRLDLKYKDRWRAICTNYNNFTEIDTNVTCRHLGFLKGNFTYHSFARNLTDYILWEKPDCTGAENNLFDCPGANTIKIGRHICDGQEVIGFQCEGLRKGLALDHWRGLDFYNSTTEAKYQLQNNYKVYMNESLSFLEYLDISYTGLDTYHGKTPELDVFYQKAAISASPHVPMMNNVTIKYGAYDALNLTEIIGPIHIANSTISYNRGYGMFIQSSIGRCLINTTEVDHNWGDGIKFYISNLTIFDFRQKFPSSKSFCAQADVSDVTYPFYQHMDLVQVDGTMISIGGSCIRTFVTSPRMKITIHFLIMEADPEATGKFIFKDGGNFGQELKHIPISNGSFPQSITTKQNTLFVKFEYKQPRDLICKHFPPCIRFLLEFTTGYDVDEEFQLHMSKVHDNIGYGVNIQDMRSKVRISNETVISSNQFGAGVHIYKGAGEIVINGSRIEKNADSGVNITYSGGYQLINGTYFIANKGYGIITEYIRLNHTRAESENKIQVVRTHFLQNELIGLRIGNYCKGGNIRVNESYFAYNKDDAFEYLSCNISTNNLTKIKMDFNTFNNNFRHAILMRPLLNTEGIITNNTFANHSLSTFRIDNGYDLLISRWYRNFLVNLNIFENRFRNNTGRYVLNIRLTQDSAIQNIYCKFNYFEKNVINNSFMYLNPRSRANAVIVLSSSNVQFQRNFINNTESVRELATHLVDPLIIINATENYWGREINMEADYEKVHKAILDQDDRYNLAQVIYHPALKTHRLYEYFLATNVPKYTWPFQRGDVIGGLLENDFECGHGRTYYVDKDIYIFPDKTLFMDSSCKLKFMPSIGMVVHGILRADGVKRESPIVFDLDDRNEFVPIENRTASVRLLDGSNEFEGRLEVEINSTWGTVCNDGWIEENSLLVCQQLGLTYKQGLSTAGEMGMENSDKPILMSWVSCDDVDVDLTKCRSVNADASACGHDKDVYIKCQKPTWAGITIAASYKLDQNQPVQRESQIRFVEMNNAGLLDPDTGTLTPTLRIDFNSYQISWLTINNSLSDGILVSYNNPYTLNKMEYVTVINSAGNGFVTKCPKLEIMHSRFDNNQKAGFLYDPFFTEYSALMIRNTIYPPRRIDMFAEPFRLIEPDQLMFLVCSSGKQPGPNQEYVVEIRSSSSNQKISLQVLDYLPVESLEKVVIYDSDKSSLNSANTKRWEIEKDLVDFPILSSSNVVTIKLNSKGQLSGRLAFAVIPQPFDSTGSYLQTSITNTTFNSNYQGIVTKHYNNPSNKRLELFHRHKKEEIYFKDVKIHNSIKHAMHMPSVTKFTDDYIPTYEDMTRPERVASINYTIFQSEFKNNAMGILAEHNHVDFANNVWQWNMDHITMQDTKAGGLFIELPRVNDKLEREIHAVKIVDSIFRNNQDFGFTVTGYYAQLMIDRNGFVNNKCLLGLIDISGMEKNMSLNSNLIKQNNCRYAIDINIHSHSEYFATMISNMELNDISDNFYDGQLFTEAMNNPKKYAVAIKGLQNIRANLNFFVNPSYDFELVAGITSILLGSSLNATHNYWGFTDQPTIRERIFDFDDWNNFAIAEYFPYLTMRDVKSIPSTGLRERILLDRNQLGGRVEVSQILKEIGQPYIVKSDLTIMPGVTLTIPAGTELQFMPNVGILVLGRLIANGLPFSRIKFVPVQPSNNPVRMKRELFYKRKHKRQLATDNIRLRGDGTLFRDAGFLELYNSSTRSWNMMCDSQFNEKTAEVICRELGKEVINVKVRFTHLYDYYFYGKAMYFRKEFWHNTYICRGDETSLKQCTTRYNYKLLPCVYSANYTFITCGERNLDAKLNYWGNIRFAMDTYEEKPLELDIGKDQSAMSYVDIVGAGFLHGEKAGAIQSTYVTPTFKFLNISNCADNGYDVIVPRQNLNIQKQNISGNLGFGINVLVLNGETSERSSSFIPSGPNTIPYNVHGLVDICRMEKEIQMKTRLILFYKYGPFTRDCVKIIKSDRTVGLRFLQLNLFQEDFSLNSIEIFDGKDVTVNNQIGHIVANSSTDTIQKLFKTTGPYMSVHVHASVSFGSYGFIAEVVQFPLPGLVFPNSEFSHTIQEAEIRKNQDGAILYKNVGETTPSLYIEHCWLGDNGYPILNLTSPPVIDISLQSTISFRFSHNQVSNNFGGMYLSTHASSLSTALKGNITNNLFAFGKNGEALNISGHYFQRLMLFQNYIYNYTAGDFRDVIHVKNVVVNLTHNYILKNVGHYIINTYSSDVGTDSQLFARNGIFDNNATALRESTIKVSQGTPKFMKNFLVNSLNDFELMTYSKPESYLLSIDAKDNWWGSERQPYISGKIYGANYDSKFVEVNYWPPIMDNRSIVEGDCLPGWIQDKKRCYRYMGGALPFEQAKQFCQSHAAFLAEARGREDFFNYLLRLMIIEPNWQKRVWVMSELSSSRCSAFEKSYIVAEEECVRNYYPFICETDPELSLPEDLSSAVQAMIIGISVGVGSVIIIILIVVCILWYIKSKRRKKERFERTASMRSSLNNLTKINSDLRGTRSTLTMLSVGASRQRLNELDNRSIDSSLGKKSQSSTVSNEANRSVHSVNSTNRSLHSVHSSNEINQNSQSAASKNVSKPIHSLRPDRSKPGKKNQVNTINSERENGERRQEEERGRQRYSRDHDEDEDSSENEKYAESSDEESDEKKSLYSESSSEEDEKNYRKYAKKHESAIKGRQIPAKITNEHILQKPLLPNKSKYEAALRPRSEDIEQSDSSGKSKSVSSYTDSVDSSVKKVPPPRSHSKENLTGPIDAKRYQPSNSNKPIPKPPAKPKPVPPSRMLIYENQNISVPLHVANPQQKSADNQDHLYKNEQNRVPLKPVIDVKPKGRSLVHNPAKKTDHSLHSNPVYDDRNYRNNSHILPADPSDSSYSTDRYEPVNFSAAVKSPYDFDQKPDDDYLPRPLGNPALGLSRERLDFQPSSFPSKLSNSQETSQSHSTFSPHQHPSRSDIFFDKLPPKPGASSSSNGRSFPSVTSQDSSAQLPPYSPGPPTFQAARSQSRDRLNKTRGSRDNFSELPPPPYSTSEERLNPRNLSGSREMLYLSQGARPKHESVETEI